MNDKRYAPAVRAITASAFDTRAERPADQDVLQVRLWDVARGGRRTAMTDLMGGKVLRLRWGTICVDCGRPLAPGERAWWFHLDDVGRCLSCADAPSPDAEAPAAATTAKPHATPSAEAPPPPQHFPPTPPAPQRPSPPSTAHSPDATEPATAPDPDRRPGRTRAPGASAQAEYERRRRQDEARNRQNLPRLLLLVLTTSLLVYVAVLVGAGFLEDQLRAIASPYLDGDVETEPIFEAWHVHLAGTVMALGFASTLLRGARRPRQSTEAWRIGAEGERRTARLLQELPPSYRVLHDLEMPRSKANIDHIVIGPSGVFTVETKSYRNGVQIKGGRVYGSGRNLDSVVQQARRQAAAVADLTGASVVPIVCVHRGLVKDEGLFQTPVVDGVRFCSGPQLSKVISGTTGALSDLAIQEIERKLD